MADLTNQRRKLARNRNVFSTTEHPENGDFVPIGYDKPTELLPGTPERIELYARRIEQGLHLFHPADLVLNEDISADLSELFARFDGRRQRHYS